MRTEEQTTIARLWSGVGTTTGFFSVWNNVARDVVLARQLSLVETARVFVLVNVSIHDALQTTQASKFVYGVWRPVTAIRAADTDLNPDTDPDSTWLPLITTPPYPAYAGNLATIGASAARALQQLVCGTNDVPVADPESARRATRRHTALRRFLAGRRRRSHGPHLWRHSLPVRSAGRSAGRPVGRGVCVRQLHAAARSTGSTEGSAS